MLNPPEGIQSTPPVKRDIFNGRIIRMVPPSSITRRERASSKAIFHPAPLWCIAGRGGGREMVNYWRVTNQRVGNTRSLPGILQYLAGSGVRRRFSCQNSSSCFVWVGLEAAHGVCCGYLKYSSTWANTFAFTSVSCLETVFSYQSEPKLQTSSMYSLFKYQKWNITTRSNYYKRLLHIFKKCKNSINLTPSLRLFLPA